MNLEFIKDIGGFETFCYQNCQRIILQMRKFKYPELHINAVLSLVFEGGTGKINTISGVRSLLPSMEQYSHRLSYGPEYSSVDILNLNKQYLDERKEPFIAGIDSYYLPYTTNYMLNHARHTLVVCDIDKDNKNVDVIDWYPPWFFRGKVAMKDFLLGRSSENPYDGTIFSGGSIDNNWAYIDEFTEREPRELLRELLNLVFTDYYCDSSSSHLSDILKEERGYQGKSYGIQALTDIRSYILNCNSQKKLNEMYISFKRVSKRNNLFLQYLECYKSVDCFPELEEAIKVSREIVSNEDVLLMVLLKYVNCMTEKTAFRLASKFEALLEIEKQRKEKLELVKNRLFKLRN